VASALSPLLAKAFNGEDWPELRVNSTLIDECFDIVLPALKDRDVHMTGLFGEPWVTHLLISGVFIAKM
jgi:hypothetical protein